MLRFSGNQFEQLETDSQVDFAAKAAAYLKRCYPAGKLTSDDTAVHRFVALATAKAASFHITEEIDVVRFCDVLIAVGGDFEKLPAFSWIRDYLREPMRATLRLDHVCERLRFAA